MTRRPFNPDLIPTQPDGPAPVPTGLITVSQLTAMVRRAIRDALPATVRVVGEISNYKRHSGGHVYFTLKDCDSELSCVMWRSDAAKLKFAPDDGMEVIAAGTVDIFERTGRYQLYVRRLEPRGVGALEIAFRQLHAKLEKEGLFDQRRKRSLPRHPRRIVVVTSPTGAAVADVLRAIERRYPCVHVLVHPVRVQGDGAAAEIAAAVRAVNACADRLGGVDLMIIGRGGGSLEDLWAFNEEVVARAIFESRIPIISAVGHEADVTIADLVADVRAATPTAAAELAVPVRDELLAALDAWRLRLDRATGARRDLLVARLDGLIRRSAFGDPFVLLLRKAQSLDEWLHRTQRSIGKRLHGVRAGVDRLDSVVRRIAPHGFLLRTSSRLSLVDRRLRLAAASALALNQRRHDASLHHFERTSPAGTVTALRQRTQHDRDALESAMIRRLATGVSRVDIAEALLSAVGHRSVLRRGYSITRRASDARVVRSVHAIGTGEKIVTEVADGRFESEVAATRDSQGSKASADS